MISVVIRNKNEAKALNVTLSVLTKMYSNAIDEIIIVDNNSTDNSLDIAKAYSCKTITINDFTYGKATNLGILSARNQYILLLSAHTIPIGTSFFKKSIEVFQDNPLIAGLRYINSYSNYIRAIDNDFLVIDGLNNGLMTACAMVNKTVWEKYKFDELLVFSEDKAWSKKVMEAGHIIKDINETFFYFAKRSLKGNINRWKFETQADYQLKGKTYHSYLKIFGVYIYNITIKNIIYVYQSIIKETKRFRASIAIKGALKKEKNKKNISK